MVGLECEPARARLVSHPEKRDLRELGVAVPTPHVAVHTGEPDLLERLVLRVVSLLPDRRPERPPPLVNGDRVVGVEDVAAQRRVVKRPEFAQHWRTEAVDRDSQRADGVPDAHEVNVDVGVRVRAPEQRGRDAARLTVLVRVPVEPVGLLYPMSVLRPEDAAVAHQPDGAASREGAAAEPEEIQLVAGLVVVHQEAVALLHVSGEPNAEPAAEQALPAARTDAGLVVQELTSAGLVLIRERQGELGHIRRRRDALVDVIRPVPGPIAADDQTLHCSPQNPTPPSRGSRGSGPRDAPAPRRGRRRARRRPRWSRLLPRSRRSCPRAARRAQLAALYVRCVTPVGDSITRAHSSVRGAPGSAPSNSRTPSPSSSGTTWSCISSISPASRYCWTTSAPPATATSPSPAAARACSSADSIPSVTNVNVVPPSFCTGSRGWWVSTNTGWWNGGSSPHQASAFGSSSHGPSPPLNIRRPITVAPTPASPSSTTSLSTFVSPPSMPCASRHACAANAHSCSRSPPAPSGSSRVWLGPAMKPSRDIEMSRVSIGMWVKNGASTEN